MAGTATAEPAALVLCCDLGARERAQRLTRRTRGAQLFDASAAAFAELAALAAQSFPRVVVVASSLSDLRQQLPACGVLGPARRLELVLLDGAASGPAAARSAGPLSAPTPATALRWRSRGEEAWLSADLRRGTRPVDVLRRVAGATGAQAHGLRVGLAGRAGEPYVAADPHVRYVGVDDVVTVSGQPVPRVDLVLEGTTQPGDLGPAGRDGAGRPRLRVLSGAAAWSEAPPAAAAFALPPVDVGVINPTGFDNGELRQVGRVARCAHPGQGAGADVLGDDGAALACIPAGAALSAGQVRLLRPLRAVHDSPGAHSGPVAHARLLIQLAAAGVPVNAADLPSQVRELLGQPLAQALHATGAADWPEPVDREASSVVLRRAALLHQAPSARWRTFAASVRLAVEPQPPVSVLLVTRRPALLGAALDHVRRQSYPSLQLVLGLHGDHFADTAVADALRDLELPSTVVRVGADLLFGDALNRVTKAAEGRYLTKMDDDDLYGPDHITDLMLAAGYSQADLVGKGAELTYLEALDVTVRRSRRSETFSRHVAGGTLLLSREVIHGVGGWRAVQRSVDYALIDQVLAAGGSVYRTHGLGFVLRRHGDGHTWDPGLDYFTARAQAQWPGQPDADRLLLA